MSANKLHLGYFLLFTVFLHDCEAGDLGLEEPQKLESIPKKRLFVQNCHRDAFQANQLNYLAFASNHSRLIQQIGVLLGTFPQFEPMPSLEMGHCVFEDITLDGEFYLPVRIVTEVTLYFALVYFSKIFEYLRFETRSSFWAKVVSFFEFRIPLFSEKGCKWL